MLYVLGRRQSHHQGGKSTRFMTNYMESCKEHATEIGIVSSLSASMWDYIEGDL